MCGHTCHELKDCSGTGSMDGCRCVVANLRIARLVGIVPILPAISLCLVLSQMESFLAGMDRAELTGFPKLKTRGLGDGGDDNATSQSSLQWTCRCNATYVSEACCESADGFL
jgi:hypothetical protein